MQSEGQSDLSKRGGKGVSREFFIDWIRCFACLTVAVNHILVNLSEDGFAKFYGIKTHNIYRLNPAGSMLSVYLFFLVSGFTMYASLQRLNAVQFMINRVFRIFPCLIASYSLYIFAGLIYHGAYGIPFPHSFLNPFKSIVDILLIRDFFPVKWTYLGVVWTLEIEWKFYIFIAIFFLTFKAKPSRVFAFACITSFIITFLYWISRRTFNMPAVSFPGDMVRWFAFSDPGLRYLTTSLPARFWYFAFMLIGSYFSMHSLGQISQVQLFSYTIATGFVLFPNKTVAASIVLFCLIYKFRLLFKQNCLIKFFSDISYPLYLIHPVSYFIISALALSGFRSPVLITTACLFVSIAISFLVSSLIEKPMIDKGRGLARRCASSG
jgi:peptidoglycan/LPS O-acetylase OafA/YrhL